MVKYVLFVVCVLCGGGGYGEEKIIERVERGGGGEGVVSMEEDGEIRWLIGKGYVGCRSWEGVKRLKGGGFGVEV